MNINQNWYCYILQSTVSNKTYNGSTNDLVRRLKQHNGILSGGAKATHIDRPYMFICYLNGFSSHQTALQCEWWIKHPTGHRMRPSKFNLPTGRIKGLNFLFQSNIWKDKFINENIVCYIKEELMQYLTNVPKNVTIELLN